MSYRLATFFCRGRSLTSRTLCSVGMRTWIYALAIILTLPKQIVVVYLGVLFGTVRALSSTRPERDG